MEERARELATLSRSRERVLDSTKHALTGVLVSKLQAIKALDDLEKTEDELFGGWDQEGSPHDDLSPEDGIVKRINRTDNVDSLRERTYVFGGDMAGLGFEAGTDTGRAGVVERENTTTAAVDSPGKVAEVVNAIEEVVADAASEGRVTKIQPIELTREPGVTAVAGGGEPEEEGCTESETWKDADDVDEDHHSDDELLANTTHGIGPRATVDIEIDSGIVNDCGSDFSNKRMAVSDEKTLNTPPRATAVAGGGGAEEEGCTESETGKDADDVDEEDHHSDDELLANTTQGISPPTSEDIEIDSGIVNECGSEFSNKRTAVSDETMITPPPSATSLGSDHYGIYDRLENSSSSSINQSKNRHRTTSSSSIRSRRGSRSGSSSSSSKNTSKGRSSKNKQRTGEGRHNASTEEESGAAPTLAAGEQLPGHKGEEGGVKEVKGKTKVATRDNPSWVQKLALLCCCSR